MIVAYLMSGHDGDAFFFENRKADIFCPVCGTLLDKKFLPQNVKPRKRWDICSSYDNRTIVTTRFKSWCERKQFPDLSFRLLSTSSGHYLFEPTRVLRLDPARAEFLNECRACGNHESIKRLGSQRLLDVSEPIVSGFFRTDIGFGSRWEKHPTEIVGIETMKEMKAERFHLVEYDPIHA